MSAEKLKAYEKIILLYFGSTGGTPNPDDVVECVRWTKESRDALQVRAEAAERERDEAIAQRDKSGERFYKAVQYGANLEEEIARRDAAASEPVLYALRFKNMQGEPEKEINDNCLFSSYEKARAYGRGGNYVTQDSGKIEWVPNAALDPEVIPLYTATPPAVLPVVKLPPLPTDRAITSAPYSLASEHMAIRAMDIIAIRDAGVEVVDE